ncbi:MAG: 4-(cytidine 5'-diphospho)-2-C-methyl-D-erythritol kinase [Sphaerochaetaceae bacterium]
METILARPAYAKVNLHLAVGQPFQDGYHPIRSLFALVNLADDIVLRVTGTSRFSVEVTGLEACNLSGEDLMSKAARLWYEKSRFPLSLQIRCGKHIPIQAGLGGGSSDAAVVLLLLQKLAGSSALEERALVEVALQVGSDVPFFLSSHCCAIVSGRGETIASVASRNLSICLVMPTSFAISTSSAYGCLDVMRSGGIASIGPPNEEIIEVFKKSPAVWNSLLYNDFQRCVAHKGFYEELTHLSCGYSGYGGISGSGACWFFVSDESAQVYAVAAEVEKRFGLDVMCWKTGLVTKDYEIR